MNLISVKKRQSGWQYKIGSCLIFFFCLEFLIWKKVHLCLGTGIVFKSTCTIYIGQLPVLLYDKYKNNYVSKFFKDALVMRIYEILPK